MEILFSAAYWLAGGSTSMANGFLDIDQEASAMWDLGFVGLERYTRSCKGY